ncbi:hypothetical protein AGABI2DRAFT_177577, partial [Agaricus bisporus var. bisporus H97]|uniref:hypothetical protein n=1 Tax=Agaricus bisporus var. bisporus (strain H97 / ATCC MYA-4626 / FGSC 10389) TaxID=936046 RepID=UPI00029F5B4C
MTAFPNAVWEKLQRNGILMNSDSDTALIVTSRQTQLAGYCLNILLYGILTVQASFPNDKNVTKAIVAFVYCIDTVQTVFAFHDFYKLLCISNNCGSNQYEAGYRFIWLTVPLTGTLVATVAQLFYARRIYILSRKKVVTGLVVILALVQLSFGLIATEEIYYSIPGRDPVLVSVSTMGWGAAGITCDLVITVYMFWFLTIQMRESSRTTQVMITKIKRLLLETGLLT